ncbi:putative leucine-rich repeat domain superfamily [Arabidopsis thaliana]
MSGLHNLGNFLVSGNSFFGSFPTSVFTISSLQWVDLGENQFKGHIEFGNTTLSPRLIGMYLGNNKFDGSIPESISKFSKLKMFSLTNNNFIGTIPKSISQLHNLYILDLSYNKMEGTVPGCLSRLTWLSLSHNSFSSIGKSLEILDRAPMRVLSLESNSFQGPFPHWVCKLRSLELLKYVQQ